ncbi:Putative YjeF domain, FDF domain, DFDF domain, YjeF domain superfamily protein [Colletotrichum destructivum]|uniref:Enhancer of mRNA-decapping protein 3 n=1 Tax=Colletotrichum destructivum TaxID=34406 RepID=A0AAX4HWQ9_9PEZI|nr:Putative YjeF domain, FDF domain, DFDF domain, YjeF domain superfamily protein [Colletotrichum destructivum]
MEFIGLQMMVTLRQPLGTMLKGTVSAIEPGTSLTLSNVFTLGTNHWLPRVIIDAANILELSESRDEVVPNTFTAPGVSPVPAPVINQPSQPAFADPAILRMGKRPGSDMRSGSEKQSLPEATPQPTLAETRDPRPGQPGVLSSVHLTGGPRDDVVSLSETLQELDVEEPTPTARRHAPESSAVPQVAHEVQSQSQKRKNRRREKQRAPRNGVTDETIPEITPMRGNAANRGKGWRQTPMLQSSPSFQPFNSLKRGIKGKKDLPENGWASEDVTEEMAEFDFENNLAKFDKRTIFDQMRKEDLIDDADRLVSHNRRPKPGTAGGKNFHYSENVLDIPSASSNAHQDFWNSEADDAANGVDRLSGRDVRSAQSSRRAESKSGPSRRSQSRKASTQLPSQPLNRVNSNHVTQSGFYLVPSNRRLETVSALQMLNLENIAANEIGLTEDMMAENAGRGIAEVTLRALEDPAIQVRFGTGGANAQNNSLATSATVVILAGNNKSGIRAISAARHLRNKGLNILVCVVGVERERDLLEDMRQQIRVFRNFGGRVHSKIELFEQLRKTASTPTTSVTLIIDALLGLAISFEELRTGDQATVYELIEWANRNEAFVLAVDVPTGIDPSTGKVSIIDGGRLYVKPRYVVAMGAPKKGLLEAMAPVSDSDPTGTETAVAEEEDWKLFIADMGLGATVWKKAGTKIRRGIDFDDKWVLQMRYQPALSQD